MINRYSDFLLENLLNESILVYSAKFKNVLKNIDSPIAKALLDIEAKDFTLANNFIDISDDKEQISFIPDRRAQQLFNPENLEKFVIYNGDGGFLTHGESNNEIFNILGYEKTTDRMFHPEVGEKGEVLSKAIGPQSGKTYLKIKFPNGISVINQEKVKFEDPTKLAFSQGRQKVRTGRGLKGILNSANLTFTDAELEKFVNLYKAEIDKMNDIFRNFELVKGDDIAYWYNFRKYEFEKSRGTLSNSCMCEKPASYFEIYTSNDVCQLLILKTEDGEKIKGRALVWNLHAPKEITYMDRVYTHNDSDVELFRQYAQKQGWYYKASNNNGSDPRMISPDGTNVNLGALFVKVNKDDYSRYPYLDTLKFFDRSRRTLSTDNGGSDVITLEDTGGGFINNEECEYCGGEGRVDCYDCDGRGENTCNNCDGDGEVTCSGCDGDCAINCNACDGEGEIECSTCEGSGKDPDDEESECSDCEGKGRQECHNCEGKGREECNDCNGNGKEECSDCNGRGEQECYNCDGSGRVDCPEC